MTTLRPLLLTLTLSLLGAAAHAAVITVGPDQPLTRVSEAARVAQDGDTVEIAPGEYRGDVAVWTQKRLTIRGLAPRPVLIADGHSAEDKAIWVMRDGDIHVDNIEFRGARVADGNGAGIRFERGRLRVSNSAFIDNQNGILTANFGDAELRIEDSLFAQAPQQTRPLPHLLYVGRIARLEITGSRFHQGHHGHLIKSRASRNEIRYNLIHDGEGGKASYEIDLPNGGVSYLVGNVISQSADTENPVVVAFGAEGNAWPDSALYLAHNTLVSARLTGAWFLRTWKDRLPPDTEVRAVNNLTVGPGTFSLTTSGSFAGNMPAIAAMLGGADILDFSLAPDTLLRRFTTAPGQARQESLAPIAEFALPIGTRPIDAPAQWAPGAFQSDGYASPAAHALESRQ